MKNLLKSFLLSLTVIFSACMPNKAEKVIYQNNSPEAGSPASHNLLNDWMKLLDADHANMSAMELLASEVILQERDSVKKLLKKKSEKELKELLEEVQDHEQIARKKYLYRDAHWSGNELFLKSTLLGSSDLDFKTQSNSIILNIAAKAKSKLLNEIMSAYSNRIVKLAREIAPDFATAIVNEKPDAVSRLLRNILNGNKQASVDELAKVIEGLEKFDEFFRGSSLNDSEQALVALSGIVAGAIADKVYEEVKGKKSFKKLAISVKKGQALAESFKELLILEKSLTDYSSAMEKDAKNFMNAAKGVGENIEKAFNEIKKDGIGNIDAKKAFQYVYDKTIGGNKTRDLGEDDRVSIAKKKWKIDSNVNELLSSASNITHNFSGILKTTETLALKLGIKLSPEVNDLIGNAKEVNAAISLAQNVIGGLSSGGVLGAVQALSGGPAAALLGGGAMGFEGQAMSQLKGINTKLDEVIKLQKQMISLQIETMAMIQKLALMIDQYHQEQMEELATIRERVVINLELSKMAMNNGINNCESLANHRLNSLSPDGLLEFEKPRLDAHIAAANAERIFTGLKGVGEIQSFIRSTHEMAFKQCQGGIVKAFGNGNLVENPILSIYSSSENDDLLKFYQENYLPLYAIIEEKMRSKSGLSMALHAPVENIRDLSLKNIYINDVAMDSRKFSYEVKNRISPMALERYASQLLIFHPYLELDKSEWAQPVEAVFAQYGEIFHDKGKSLKRSRGLLERALYWTQSAIAQEAILAGEPFLADLISENSLEQFFKVEKPCKASGDEAKRACAVRTNRILMKNLMLFSFYANAEKYGYRPEDYKWAYENKDTEEIEKLLFQNKVKGIVEKELRVTVIKEYASLALPTPEELAEGQIFYSEDMGRLLRLQEKLLDALIKVTPIQDRAVKKKLGMHVLSKLID